MKYKIVGKSGIKVSEICFGCMSLGEDHAENALLLQHAVDVGINFFDTADLYQKGFNETTVGLALRDKRKQIVLATKVGNQWREDGSGWDWNPTKAYILKAVESSLKRLQTDYIDLYQLHGGTINDPIDETIEAFELLKQQGKILHYGISSIRPNVIREYVKRSSLVSVMMQYSLLDRRPEETALELLKQNAIGVLARGSLARGLLAGKLAEAYLNYGPEKVELMADKVRSLTTEDRNAAAVAIRYALHHPAVTSAVVGIRTMDQLNDVVEAGKTSPLTEEEINILRNVIEPNTYTEHR